MTPLITSAPRASRDELDPRSVLIRWSLLLGAALWTGVIVVVVFNYHIPEPVGVLGITINGHSYSGNPPALALFERDPVSAYMIVVAPVVGLVVGAATLAVRARHRSTAQGAAALIVGACIALFSLFGLLWGVASVGVVGGLVALSALPIKTSAQSS
jgi:hypothetical protein